LDDSAAIPIIFTTSAASSVSFFVNVTPEVITFNTLAVSSISFLSTTVVLIYRNMKQFVIIERNYFVYSKD